jgi:hypothetical protein
MELHIGEEIKPSAMIENISYILLKLHDQNVSTHLYY